MPVWLSLLLTAPFVGSFVGVLVRRLPLRETLFGRSHCEACGHSLSPIELVPVASFAALRGRCRACSAPIPRYHLAAELAAVAVAVPAVAIAGSAAAAWATACLGWALLALAWIDWRHMILPDALTLPLLLAGLCVTAIVQPAMLADHAGAAICGYLAFRLLAAAFKRLRRVDGLGEGDAKLFAAGGAWLGLAAMPEVALIAGVSGIALALARRAGRQDRVPFGPPLAAAIYVMQLLAQRG